MWPSQTHRVRTCHTQLRTKNIQSDDQEFGRFAVVIRLDTLVVAAKVADDPYLTSTRK